ncbi:MAG: response regulator [Planctomycetota bacterium]
MSKRVLDVGNCGPDHSSIRRFFSANFAGVEVDQTHGPGDTIEALRNQQYDLVLINRKLDQDYSDGLEIIKQIKADGDLAEAPIMMITNYEEHQQLAIDAGALLGFGKLELQSTETIERVRSALGLGS